MAIKEYREFFLRATRQTMGSKPDKETNFPVEYQVTDASGNQIMAFNRFLKEHFPSEDVFRKLFESLTFKLNAEDTATQDIQGLARIVTGHNIIDRTDVDVEGSEEFTTFVVPSAMPIVSAGTDIDITVNIRKASDNSIVTSIPVGDRDIYYLEYVINSTVTVPPPVTINKQLVEPINLLFQQANTLSEDVNDSQRLVLGTHQLPANTLNDDFAFIEYDIYWMDENNISPSILTFEIYIGTSDNINLCSKVYSSDFLEPNVSTFRHIIQKDIKIHRVDTTGYFIKTDSKAYKTNSGFGALLSAVGFTFNDVGGVTVDDAQRNTIQAEPTTTNIDWTSDVKVHFRLYTAGANKNDFVSDYFKIFGMVKRPNI